MIEDITQTKTTKEWLEVLDESGMPYAAVNDVQDTLNHEHGTFSLPFTWSQWQTTDTSQYKHEGWCKRSSIRPVAQ
jgi:crotonobetainyl-CoA:carnitine CoA-transferase CaiB-like acyl-CoA transferase